MKPTKVRNKQIYRATNQFRSKQLGTTLSKELRQKYNRRSIRILIGDTVKIIRGEYKGIDAKVTKISLAKNSIAVEGVQREKLKGGKIDLYIHSTNAVITALNTEDNWRVKILEHKPKSKIKSMKSESKPEAKKKSESKPEAKNPKNKTRKKITKKSEN